MNDEQKTDFNQYWGLPKDVSEWSSKAIAELVSLGYEMSDQGEPMYEAYALGMVAIISELRALGQSLAELKQLHMILVDMLRVQKEARIPLEDKSTE